MYFCNQGTRCITHAQLAFWGFWADTRRPPVGAEDQHGAYRDFLDRFNEDCPTTPQLVHHVAVMHDFMMHVNRASVGFQCKLDNIHCSNHARAKPTRPDAHQGLASVLSALYVR